MQTRVPYTVGVLPQAEIDRITSRFREICLQFEGATEKLSHGEPTFFVGKQFANMDTYHHGGEWLSAWVAAPPGAQEVLIDANSERFFRPPYVGHRGWIGIRLEPEPDWDEVAGLLADAVTHVRPVRKTRS